MVIEIKKSIKPVNYFEAIDLLESRLKNIAANKEKELIWILEHPEIFTAGTSYKDCLLYTSPSPRDRTRSRMPSSA